MSHLVIMVEGETEELVLKNFLRPFWEKAFQDIEVIYEGKGNGYFIAEFVEDVRRELTDDSYVLCLIDLYKEPFRVYDPNTMTVEEGFRRLKQVLESQIIHPKRWRFAAFPVVCELEAWLLADPVVMKSLGSKSPPNPELIRHPAVELKKLRPDYSKRLTGKALFGDAKAQRVYDDHCEHFKLLADWLQNPPKQPKDDTITKSIKAWELELERLQDEYYSLEHQLDDGVVRSIDEDEQLLEAIIQAERAINNHLAENPASSHMK